MDFPKLSTLLFWIQERDSIRVKKEAGLPKPWTDDAVLQNFRFCNVRRQDDKVTSWLRNRWYPLYDAPNFVGGMTLARLINEPATLEFIGFPEPERWEWTLGELKDWRDLGKRVFNPAYIVTTCGVKMDKLDYVVRVAKEADHAWARRDPKPRSLADAFKVLTSVDGLRGTGFLTAQVIADLKYTPHLAEAYDWFTWCSPGPGSMRGLSRLTGKDYETKWNADLFRKVINDLRDVVSDEIAVDLCAQDMQNCLCEFDKYVRALEGGKPKQNYNGYGRPSR
jgi:hypothetical protein